MLPKNFIDRYGQEPKKFVIDKLREFDYVVLGDTHNEIALDEFVLQLIPKLSKQGKFKLHLELEDFLQGYIEEYMKTGDEGNLQKVIERQRELVRRGYPFEERITGPYFDIIRESRKDGAEVIAIDDNCDKDNGSELIQNLRRSDEHMVKNLSGSGLVYAGELHFEAYDLRLWNYKTRYRIMQETISMNKDNRTYGLTNAMRPLLNGHSVAFDLTQKEVRDMIDFFHEQMSRDEHEFVPPFCSVKPYLRFEGLIYHP